MDGKTLDAISTPRPSLDSSYPYNSDGASQPVQDADEQALKTFPAHVRKVQRSGIIVHRPNTREMLLIPSRSRSRYCEPGRRRIGRELQRRLGSEPRPGVFLTLTVDPKAYDSRIAATRDIWHRWGRLLDTLNASRRRKGATAALKYAAVLEFTKKGWPHLHAMFPDLGWLTSQRRLAALWGSHVWVCKANAAASRYVIKYLRKLPRDQWQAILWAAGARLYAVSQALYSGKARASSGVWAFLAFVYGAPLADLDGATPPTPDLARLHFPRDREYIAAATWDSGCHPPLPSTALA